MKTTHILLALGGAVVAYVAVKHFMPDQAPKKPTPSVGSGLDSVVNGVKSIVSVFSTSPSSTPNSPGVKAGGGAGDVLTDNSPWSASIGVDEAEPNIATDETLTRKQRVISNGVDSQYAYTGLDFDRS